MRTRRWLTTLLTSLGLLVLLGPAGQPAQANPSRPTAPLPVAGYPSASGSDPGFQRWHRARTSPSSSSARHTTGPVASGRHHRSGSEVNIDRPGAIAFDSTTDTIYVSNIDTGVISVVDARSCNARRQHCRPPVATFPGVSDVLYTTIDPSTRTLYLTHGLGSETDGGLAVLDLRHCQARDVSGCRGPVASIPLAFGEAGGLALDAATHTMFVGSIKTSVNLLDTNACNAIRPQGCAGFVSTITTLPIPIFPLVDPSTRTLYVANGGDEDSGNTLSVIDISTCHVGATSGCSQTPVTTRTGMGPDFTAIDYRTGTLYVNTRGNFTFGLSVIDQRRCNARNTSGCSNVEPPSVPIGPFSGFPVVSTSSPTVYTESFGSDTLDVIDTRHCRAGDTSGCRRPHPTIQTASGEPWWLAMDPRTDSLYVTATSAGVLQVIDARTCSALRTDGCRREAPAFAGGGGSALDPGLHTLFENFGPPGGTGLRFVDTRTCNVSHSEGCTSDVPTAAIGDDLRNMVADVGTHTLYVQTGDSVLVVDATRCNTERQDGCTPLATVPVDSPNVIQLNPKTHTVYVAQGPKSSVAVIPGARCNRLDLSACADPLVIVPTKGDANIAYVDPSTNTVYVSSTSTTMSLIDGAACDARTAGCRTVATTDVGGSSVATAFDPQTHTAFVSLGVGTEEQGAQPSRVGIIDTQRCSARQTAGCGTTWPTTLVGRGPIGVTFVPQTRTLVTTDVFAATISLTDTSHCNAMDSSRCSRRSKEIAVGYYTVVSYADSRHNTLYVLNNFGYAGDDYAGPTTSMINLRHPCRSDLCFHA